MRQERTKAYVTEQNANFDDEMRSIYVFALLYLLMIAPLSAELTC